MEKSMRKVSLICFIVLCLGMIGCTYAEEVASDAETVLQFAFNAADAPLACGETYTVGSADTDVTVNDARFFVSNVRLTTADGSETPFALRQDGLWQYDNVALLDFEDGTAGCVEGGTAEMNNTVIGVVPDGEYTGVTFDLGVPFDLNHVDVTTAESPLNVASMWWNWRGGYKFVRLDLMTESNPWLMHVGSVGCDASDKTEPPAEPCARPNVATIQLDGFEAGMNVIVADIATLFANVDLSQSEPQPHGCMSGVDDPDCANLLPALGLDDGTAQQFFRVE